MSSGLRGGGHLEKESTLRDFRAAAEAEKRDHLEVPEAILPPPLLFVVPRLGRRRRFIILFSFRRRKGGQIWGLLRGRRRERLYCVFVD